MSTLQALKRQQTPASVWRAVADGTIGDELLEWPPDLFALTEVILQRSEAYRFALSPPAGSRWPPDQMPSWSDAVIEDGREWSAWVADRTGELPDLLAREWKVLRDPEDTPLEQLTEARDWRLCEALLTHHAIADEACAGLGVALTASDGNASVYRARARELLARTGTLARIPPHFVRVLPKVRTSPTGSSWRALPLRMRARSRRRSALAQDPRPSPWHGPSCPGRQLSAAAVAAAGARVGLPSRRRLGTQPRQGALRLL
jgi:hypothetical protein